jgi:hypothetical protein
MEWDWGPLLQVFLPVASAIQSHPNRTLLQAKKKKKKPDCNEGKEHWMSFFLGHH